MRLFTPQIAGGYGHVQILLPQLDLFGVGADVEEARDDLLEQVRLYCDEYFDDPLLFERGGAEAHLPLLLAVQGAETDERLAALIFC